MQYFVEINKFVSPERDIDTNEPNSPNGYGKSSKPESARNISTQDAQP